MSGHGDGHGHGHSHDCGGGHSHNGIEDVPDSERIAQYSLYSKIDLERVQCLNEVVDGSGKTVFKPWDQRLQKVEVLTFL